MRNWIVVLLLGLLGVMAACAPQVSTDPGEVVYEVPVSNVLGVQTTVAGDPVTTRLAQALVVFYTLEAPVLEGYGRWTPQLSQGTSVIYVSEKRNAQSAVTGKIEMRWTLGHRKDGNGSVRLETLTSEKLDVSSIESAAFARLDRTYRRLGGSR